MKKFEVIEPEVPELPIYRKRLRIGYFGGFYPVKGVQVLLDAMQKVRWGQLLMFCDVPADFLKGRQLYGHDNVLVMGAYSRCELPLLLNLVDCVVCPSINESYGLVSREVQMLGVPCISTSTGGQVGTVPPGDAEALAKAIQEVIDEKIEKE